MKPKLGDTVAVTFLDHCEDCDEGKPIAFTLFGLLSTITRTSYEITCWAYADGVRRGDGNEKRFAIVRKAITSIRILKPNR